ncbi:MAG: NifU family protein [Anaerovoracaceae bacterium]|jgi:Fe-S cluster biogenesis protein NfuA
MEEKITEVLKEKVDPILAEHYGGAMLTEFKDGVAYVRLTGACAQCPSAQSTIENVVNEVLTTEVKDVKRAELDTSVSEETMDMVKKILNHEVEL